MIYTTHRFRNTETLARAQQWLGEVGIPSDQIEISSTGLPSLTVSTNFAQTAEVSLILNAVELTDPEGWPSLDETSSAPFSIIAVAPDSPPVSEASTSPIGWHPTD